MAATMWRTAVAILTMLLAVVVSGNSLFFAQLGVDTFDARRRKLTHSFAARLLASGNGIISLLYAPMLSPEVSSGVGTASWSSERKDPFLTENEAHSFVGNRRVKRSFWSLFANLEEECAHEGCSFEEVREWDRSTSEAQEYLMTLACRLWPCSTGYRCQGARHGTTGSGAHWRVCNAVCFGSTSCPHGGHCSRPDYCSGCERGYESPRCADVDECDERRTCDVHATCTNTDGSYSCQCASGYVGDGHTCTETSAKTTTPPAEPTTTTAKPTTSVPTTEGKAPSTEKPAAVQGTESVKTSPSPEITTEDPELLGDAAKVSDVCGDDGKQSCGNPPMSVVEKTMLIVGTFAFVFACGIAFVIYHMKLKNGALFPAWLVRRRRGPPPPYSEGTVNVATVAAKVELPPDIKISTTDKDDPPPGYEISGALPPGYEISGEIPPGYEISGELPPGKEIPADPLKILPPQDTDVTDIEFVLKSNALEEKSSMA
ncbi:PREDICTED: uncharacterized protein LOC109467270 [Branchiostoma belcheri]|uniref:Uncharacterized protein LOC109467270 n=1 Tax=Branchiostoma belcheri TaxID=7741 RepID=A0A6P4YQ33_BRABE|nr:PREDICTED: uncharacterized protein LOC109467270 [Branchiostoma belcheri]